MNHQFVDVNYKGLNHSHLPRLSWSGAVCIVVDFTTAKTSLWLDL